MKYKMICADYPDGLTREVQKALDEGWDLYGHPGYTANSQLSGYWYQAVTFYDKVSQNLPIPGYPLGTQVSYTVQTTDTHPTPSF